MLEVRLLGQFAVWRDGLPVEIPSRPAQSLLAYLILNAGTAHRRERLAGLLWPDAAEANARAYLRKALWQMRKSVAGEAEADYLLVDEISIAFDANSDYWLDAAVLQAKVAESTLLDELTRDVSVYQGELLPGFYDEWVVLERERLRAIFDQRMNLLLNRLVEEARWPEVLEWGERWIALGQTPEPAYRALMTAHAASGDMSKVAAVYERCVRALRRDLGVELSEQTQALYGRLSKGETIPGQPKAVAPSGPQAVPAVRVSPPQRRLTNLPVPLTSFIGREWEIAEVKRLLSSARLLTLTGAGGSGKTRLAIQVATDLVDEYPDGVWWVELATLADPTLVPQVLIAALGLRETPNEPLSQTLTDFLRSRQLLLILDNCEHLIEACARLAGDLLSACPALKILATSREVLGIDGEHVFQVPTLSLPDPQHESRIHELMQSESIRLFVDRATTVQADFALTAMNAPAVAQVCRRLDGIPLAIELAAARVKMLSPEQIAARLNDRFRLLTSGSRTALPRQQTLQALIAWSYDLLSEPERALLRRLSAFAGGWTLEAAEAVCAGEGVEAEDVLDLLTQLANKSLVLAEQSPGDEARYRLLETIREYARDKLTEAGEAELLRDRHMEYFATLAEEAEPRLTSPGQATWFNRLELEHANLRAAIEWSWKSGQMTSGLRIIGALRRFWTARRHYSEVLERARRMLSSPEPSQRTAAWAKALNTAGFLYWILGKPAEARPLLEMALAIGREIADQSIVAWSLMFLGLVATFEGNYPVARSSFEEGSAIAREFDPASTYPIGWSLAFLGDVALYEGDYGRAQRLYEEGVIRLRELDDKGILAYLARRLAQVALRQGDLEKAAALCQESLSLNLATGDRAAVAACVAAFAGVAVARGQVERAAWLLGAAQGLVDFIPATLLPADHAEFERNVAALRAQLDEATFVAAWVEGRAMTVEEAVGYALGG